VNGVYHPPRNSSGGLRRRSKAVCTPPRAKLCEKGCVRCLHAATCLKSKRRAWARRFSSAWTSWIVAKSCPCTQQSPRRAIELQPAVVHVDRRRSHPKGPAGSDEIAERNPDAADRLIERLIAACDMLGRRPSLGHRRRDLVPMRDDIRFWPIGRYLIVCRRRQDGIQAVRILSGQRDIAARLGCVLRRGCFSSQV
jgi:toxin ParE1/3/4